MSEIDWSKAPEGYPIWIEDLKPHIWSDMSGWHKEEEDRYVGENGEFWNKPEDGFYRVYRNRNESWTGTGLPPVGTVCEWKLKQEFGYVAAEVLFVSDKSIVLRRKDGFEWQEVPSRCVFRPIRTQAQIEAEERERAIRDMSNEISGYMGFDNPRSSDVGIATYLHDHGYRKQGEAK